MASGSRALPRRDEALPGSAGSAPASAMEHAISIRWTSFTDADAGSRSERLRNLGAELNLLFAYQIEAVESFATFTDGDEPLLIVGKPAGLDVSIEIEAHFGLYVLRDAAVEAGCVIITGSTNRLIDHIVDGVSCAPDNRTLRTASSAVETLVGHTIADVEKQLILRTLLHYQGDQQLVAFALGIDSALLHAKLRAYLFRKASRQ